MAVKNMEASVLARLKNCAKTESISFEVMLQLFCQEEFLRRLSATEYVDNLILKGGMFIYTLTGFDSRVTRDIDFMLRKQSNDLNRMESIMKAVCSAPSENDFISLEVLGTEQISVEKKYPGVKTRLVGHIGNVRVPFSIDVGIDDVVFPRAEKRRIAARLPGFSVPEVYTYSLESTVAEKFDAILQRMGATSRMKDFYDIYYLSGIFNFDGSILGQAVRMTLERRKRTLSPDAFNEIAGFKDSTFMCTLWRAFEPARTSGLAFEAALCRLSLFLKPIYESILTDEPFCLMWDCKKAEWSKAPDGPVPSEN